MAPRISLSALLSLGLLALIPLPLQAQVRGDAAQRDRHLEIVAQANEPTTLHTSVPLSVGGVSVPAGSVTLYAIPAEGHWEIVVNSSVDRWGIPINADVRAHDVGSFHVEPSALAEAVE